MVRMYIKSSDRSNPKKLLDFLKSAQNYNRLLALELCDTYFKFEEKIYLLGAMGKSREALKLIVEEMNDQVMAIEFCKEHQDDKELWEDLINYSKNNPEFVSHLLRYNTVSGVIILYPASSDTWAELIRTNWTLRSW